MKHLKLLIPALLMLTLYACKKHESTDVNTETAEKLVNIARVQNNGAEVYVTAYQNTHDSLEAMNTLSQWMLDQEEVDNVYCYSAGLLEVNFKNGLRSYIDFIQEDANQQVLTRGGGGGGTFTSSYNTYKTEATATIKIPNKKVLILNPFFYSMYNGVYNKNQLFDSRFDVTVINEGDVTYPLLSTLDQYGFVILNTHGVPNGFFLKHLLKMKPGDWDGTLSRDIILDSISNQLHIPMAKFANGELEFDMCVILDQYHISNKWAMVSVTDKFIRNSSLNFNQSILFGNHCWSGFTYYGPAERNLPEAWHSKGVVSYYGYAQDNNSSGPVLNTYAKQWEDTLIINLVGGDSTGIAHLAGNVTKMSHQIQVEAAPELVARGLHIGAAAIKPLYFTQFHSPSYIYKDCGDTLTDPRDGKKYPTVCIGEQVWMAKNLNWEGAGTCYDNDPTSCAKYGRLYTWSEVTHDSSSSANPGTVQGICPMGWHVPSAAEMQELIDYAGGDMVAGAKLKSTSALWVDADPSTDDFGFSALPAGECSTFQGLYDCFNEESNADFWTSTKTFDPVSFEFGLGDYVGQFNNNTDNHYSCRCVRKK